jgi:hypothetical protein
VTGHEYQIGDLQPGVSVAVALAPTSDSHVEISFTNNAGIQCKLNLGGYFGPAIPVRISAKIDSGSIVSCHFSYVAGLEN